MELMKPNERHQAASPKPFIKWVGGKRQLVNDILTRTPTSYANYFEPFVGGGAVLFNLPACSDKILTVSDINPELINTYRVIKKNPEELIQLLSEHVNTPEYFYGMRALDRDPSFHCASDVARASRFIFLNKTAFNGLYRVNSKGFFNTPFGRYKNPNICDASNIRVCSRFLRHVNILNEDFQVVEKLAQPRDLIYFDPPYAPLSATANFTSYTKGGFDLDMQLTLKKTCDRLHEKGCYFLLSNSSAELIRELYQDYTVEEVYARRSINCKGTDRGKIPELLVRNYE